VALRLITGVAHSYTDTTHPISNTSIMVNYELDFSPTALILNIVTRPLNDAGGYTSLTAEQEETLKGVKQQYWTPVPETLCRACG
jgi:hypothetical protein